ncbi:MAG: transglycosylase domain-containing protein [Verrucomicrobiota bacterium JB023]|nr:transglycosylase domain-containing protein [Verrucomicrobiota bacterium JB023]
MPFIVFVIPSGRRMTWIDHEEPRLIDQIPPWVRAAFRLALRFAVIALLIGALIIVFYFLQASRFAISEVQKMPERTILLDSEGKELAAVHGSSRRLISREDIPDHLVKALVAREDRSYFEHGGVHLRGIARAFIRNLIDRGYTQGASTLTMQLARNTFNLREQTIHRKLLEIAISYRIESNFSKDEILTAYLNRIYFGSGAWGIEQAARSYFGKSTRELTLAESALLVGIIRAPHDFSPRNSLKSALRERNQVLTTLASLGEISSEQAKASKEAAIHLMPEKEAKTDAIRCVRRHLNELLAKSDYSLGGLTATSTISSNLQDRAKAGVSKLLSPHPDLQAALVAIEPSSGAIRAVITARDANASQFNRAFDTRRQIGPVFEPFVYAFSVERGALPIPRQPVQTARQLPKGELARLAKRLGFKGPFTEGDDLARGNLQTTCLEVATALASLANQGEKPRTYLIEKLQDEDDEILFKNEPSHKLVLDARAASAATDTTRQDSWVSLNAPKNDLWGIHLSDDLVVALWLGFDNPKSIPAPDSLTLSVETFLENLSAPDPLPGNLEH